MDQKVPYQNKENQFKEIVERLKKLEKVRAYEEAEVYCEKVCKKWKISPMSCAYKCEIWILKNEILKEKKNV
ncbi:MAG: hypothetical protein NZ942_03980 [Candidatus Aenigmarchaeota archaeon]|nr:hypothetical protein [Candidatus Aenigmarchaeota archaeon]